MITQGFKNPDWITNISSQTTKITTMTTDFEYLIDQKLSSIYTAPALEEGIMTELSLVKTEGVVGAETKFSLQVTISNGLPRYGSLRIDLLENTLQPPESEVICMDGTKQLDCTFEVYSSGYVKYIWI